MTKQDVMNELKGINFVRVKFHKISPYMKRRYKPEFWQSEAWIYTPNVKYGYLITEEDFSDIEFRKNYFDMIRQEVH